LQQSIGRAGRGHLGLAFVPEVISFEKHYDDVPNIRHAEFVMSMYDYISKQYNTPAVSLETLKTLLPMQKSLNILEVDRLLLLFSSRSVNTKVDRTFVPNLTHLLGMSSCHEFAKDILHGSYRPDASTIASFVASKFEDLSTEYKDEMSSDISAEVSFLVENDASVVKVLQPERPGLVLLQKGATLEQIPPPPR
jgi:hypothetical protein